MSCPTPIFEILFQSLAYLSLHHTSITHYNSQAFGGFGGENNQASKDPV